MTTSFDPTYTIAYFVRQFSERNNRIIDTILSETMEALTRYHWPGNIRELQNVIERAVIITKGATLKVSLDELKPDARLKTSESCDTIREILSETERTEILRALESNFRTRWSSGPARDQAHDASISNAEIRHSLIAHASFRRPNTPFYWRSVRPASSGMARPQSRAG
jgi:transcriptional regulator with GAF, ATPase, and Fis domain